MKNDCGYCSLASSPWVLATGGGWVIALANNQYTLGRAALTSERYIGSLSELLPSDWVALGMLTRRLELAAQGAFGATHINMLWGSNSAQPGHPAPHQHIHLFPRYSEQVQVGEEVFFDPTYGDLPDFMQHREAGRNTRIIIYRRLLERL